MDCYHIYFNDSNQSVALIQCINVYFTETLLCTVYCVYSVSVSVGVFVFCRVSVFFFFLGEISDMHKEKNE